MNCYVCGYNLPKDSPFCFKCGADSEDRGKQKQTYKLIINEISDKVVLNKVAGYISIFTGMEEDRENIKKSLLNLPTIIFPFVPARSVMELEEKISALGAKVVLVPNQKRHITERTPSPQSLKIPGIILFIFLLCGVFFAFYSLTKRQMLSEEKVSSYKTPDHQMKDSTFTQPERSLVQKGTGVEGGGGWKNNESGINLFNKGDYEGAISLFEDALYLEPGKREYRNNLSAAFTALGWKKLKGKSYQDAQTFFERAYIYTPEDYNVNKGLGFTKYKLKEFDEAKVFLLEVIDKNPKDMDILGVLGEIFCLQDDIARANEYLEKIKIIDPSSLTATILEEELKSKKTQTTFAPH